MSNVILTPSYFQDNKFTSKSERFQVIQPSHIGQVLADHGFDLVHLKTGRAKSEEKKDFQTTVARYRSRDQFEVDGHALDLIFKVPHLYGALTGVLGLFRGLCSNQLNVGKHFETIKVSHVGNPLESLNQLIPMLLQQREKLVETVRIMQSREVTPSEVVELARSMAKTRLVGIEDVERIELNNLIIPNRSDDLKKDLWTVFNVIQENLIRRGLKYETIKTVNDQSVHRNMTTRKVNEYSTKAIDFNGSIFDQAMLLLQ